MACPDHRDLHSFPTRRSSDLLQSCPPVSPTTCNPVLLSPPPPATLSSHRPARKGRVRSEEHTSELQSRGHLVCRLLLEKKKKREPTHTTRTRRRNHRVN